MRRSADTPWAFRFISWLYWAMSDYGNSAVRPFLTMTLVFCCVVPIYALTLEPGKSQIHAWDSAIRFAAQQIVRPFAAFSGDVRCGSVPTSCLSDAILILAAVQSVITIISLALFFVPLRRRFHL